MYRGLKEKFNSWAQALRENSAPVVWIPSSCFYAERIDLPEGIQVPDVESFLLLELEQVAPFPVESLYYGYILDHPQVPTQALLYATYVERVRALMGQDLSLAFYALPDFFAFLPWLHTQNMGRYIFNGHSLALLVFEKGSALPSKVYSTFFKDAPTQGELMAAQQSLKQRYGGACAQQVHTVAHFELLKDDTLACFFTDDIGVPSVRKTLAQLWQADARDALFREAEIRKRSLDHKLWHGLTAGAVSVACLLGLTFMGSLGQLYLKNREIFLKKETERVERIEENSNLLKRLDQFAAQELRPFKMLEVLNKDRPNTLYFVSAKAEDLVEMLVDGIARSVDEVNTYKENLERHEDLASVMLDNVSSSGGTVRFSMKTRFKEGFERT